MNLPGRGNAAGVSCASSGDTSIETQPSTPSVALNIGRK